MTHADLIDRLNAGSGPDRELDALVWCALRHDSKPDLLGSPDGKCTGWILMGENAVQHRTPEYTASLDACIGLMKEVLPGWDWEKFRGNMILLIQPIDAAHVRRLDFAGSSQHDDLPRALLIAILQAVGEAG